MVQSYIPLNQTDSRTLSNAYIGLESITIDRIHGVNAFMITSLICVSRNCANSALNVPSGAFSNVPSVTDSNVPLQMWLL